MFLFQAPASLISHMKHSFNYRLPPLRARPKRRFCGGGASSYQFIATRCCHPLIYTPFSGLQSRGAGLARLAEGFSGQDVRICFDV